MKAPCPKTLIPVIENLSALIKSYTSRPRRVNESNTIRALVTPMIEALGWATDDLDEVQSEYRHTSKDNPVDYALLLEGSPVLFIEAKALDEKLDDRKWIIQTLNYANACNVEWAVLTNGAEWRVYNVHAKVEAEEKLFYTTHLDGPTPAETARRLSMLGKDNMAPRRALDKAWREAAVDRSMRKVIETLPDNRPAVRALARASDGLSEADVREALRRLRLRADWRDEDDLFPAQHSDQEQSSQTTAPALIEIDPTLDETEDKKSPSWTKIRIRELIEAGYLKVGDKIRLRAHKDKGATIVNGRLCSYQGREMTYSRWGMEITGWVAIRIYTHAETSAGRSLQDLRLELASKNLGEADSTEKLLATSPTEK